MTLDLSREARARHDAGLRSRLPAGARGALRKERDADALLVEIDAQDLECPGHPRGDLSGPSLRSSRRSEGGAVRQPFDARLELDERPELRDARHASGAYLSDLIRFVDARPWIGAELLQPERNLPLVLVHPQHLDGDLLAGLDDLRRVRHARPSHLGDVEQALYAAAQIDERAEVAHGDDAPGHHRAGDDRLPRLGGARLLRFLEERAPRDDQVLAAFRVLGDPEFVDAPYVRRRVHPDDVDLRERAERALAGDAHLVAALHLPLDLSFHRKTGAECAFELAIGRGPSHQLAGKRQPSDGGHHRRLNPVANRDLENTLVVLELRDFNRRFALAADIDERLRRPDGDDGALQGLTPLEALRFGRRLEHGGEIFFLGLAHDTLLTMGRSPRSLSLWYRVGLAAGAAAGERDEDFRSDQPLFAALDPLR